MVDGSWLDSGSPAVEIECSRIQKHHAGLLDEFGQRRLAIEFMATARLITDSNIRTSILALAEKWLDRAERGSTQPEDFDRAACLRDIQTKIGQAFRAKYDLPQELSHRMRTLLMQLNEGNEKGAESVRPPQLAAMPPFGQPTSASE